MVFNTEAGTLEELPPVIKMKLDKTTLDSSCFAQEGLRLIVQAGNSLKSPRSIEDDPKVNFRQCACKVSMGHSQYTMH